MLGDGLGRAGDRLEKMRLSVNFRTKEGQFLSTQTHTTKF